MIERVKQVPTFLLQRIFTYLLFQSLKLKLFLRKIIHESAESFSQSTVLYSLRKKSILNLCHVMVLLLFGRDRIKPIECGAWIILNISLSLLNIIKFMSEF